MQISAANRGIKGVRREDEKREVNRGEYGGDSRWRGCCLSTKTYFSILRSVGKEIIQNFRNREVALVKL